MMGNRNSRCRGAMRNLSTWMMHRRAAFT